MPELDWSESNTLRRRAGQAHQRGERRRDVGGRARDRARPVRAEEYAQGNLGRFVVTEAWVEESDAVSDGVFVRAKTNSVRCITAPCPTITEKALNTSRSANIAGIDWSFAGLTDRETESFQAALSTDSGVIIAGDRYTVSENGHTAKGRTATAAYARLVEPTP